MSNHLTPSELAAETGIDRSEVIQTCMQLGVPIFEGKIDKTLFRASMDACDQTPGEVAPGHSG